MSTHSFQRWKDWATKIGVFIAVMCLSFTVLIPATYAASVEVTVNGVTYTVDSGNPVAGAKAIKYDRRAISRNLVIPGSIEHDGANYTVTTIGEGAFKYASLDSVVLSDGVVTVEKDAFSSVRMQSLTLPESLQEIGESAFQGNNLTSLNIPSGVTNIGTLAFKSNRLTEVNLSDSVETIGESAFESNSIKAFTFPDSVTTVGSAVLKNNFSLTSVHIGAGMTRIPASAFINTAIETIDIPAQVTWIGPAAFAASGLTSLAIPETVKWIGPAAFQANKIASLTLPEGLTDIMDSTFKTNKLTDVKLPSTLKTMGPGAFASNLLTSVTIPNGVTAIPEQAFHSNKLTELVLPEGLATIGEGAFEYNNLTTLNVPGTVTSIGRSAFGSNDLQLVTLNGPAPTIHEPGSWMAHSGSFGTHKDGVIIEYPTEYGAPTVADGYTEPTWKKYTTRARVTTKLILMTSVVGGTSQPEDVSVSAEAGVRSVSGTGEHVIEAGTWKLNATELPPGDAINGGYVNDGWACQRGEDLLEVANGAVTIAVGDTVVCTHSYHWVEGTGPEPAPVTVESNLSQVVQGHPITFTASGYAPNEVVAFHVYSTPVEVGTAVANAEGVATIEWTVLGDFEVGMHEVTSTGDSGEARNSFEVLARPAYKGGADTAPSTQDSRDKTQKLTAKPLKDGAVGGLAQTGVGAESLLGSMLLFLLAGVALVSRKRERHI